MNPLFLRGILGVVAIGAVGWLLISGTTSEGAGVEAASARTALLPVTVAPSPAVVQTVPFREEPASDARLGVASKGHGLRVLTLRSDGTALAGVGVSLARGGSGLFEPAGITNARGGLSVQLTGEGLVGIGIDRGLVRYVDVGAAESSTITFTVPLGITIKGIVRDETGMGVPDAEIFVRGSQSTATGQVVHRAGPSGSFELQDIPPGTLVGARAPGHAAARMQRVAGTEGSSRELLFVLSRGRHEIRGVVTGLGVPLAGARVHAARPLESPMETPLSAVDTDASGRFVLPDLDVGPWLIVVRHVGFAPKVAELVAALGSHGTLSVELAKGAVLCGRVLNSAGASVSGIPVRVHLAHPIVPKDATTDGEGAWRVESLPMGPATVRVGAHPHQREASFILPEEGLVRWDAVLEQAARVTGHVVDLSGAPKEGWTVELRGALASTRESTDALGAFSFEGALGSLDLWVFPPHDTVLPSVVRKNVPTTGVPITVTVSASDEATAWVRGRLETADGRPCAGALTVWSEIVGARGRPVRTEADGTFVVGPLKPGSYGLTARLPELPSVSLPGIQLEAREVRDLGIVRLPPLGELNVRVLSGLDRGSVRVRLRESDARFLPTGDAWTSGPLFSGTYVLEVRVQGLPVVVRPVIVSPGRPTEETVSPLPGVPTTLELPLPAEGKDPKEIHVVVRSGSDETLLETVTFHWHRSDGPRPMVTLDLPPGSYVWESEEHRQRFTVTRW